jgi:hypothetical protein
MFSDDVAEAFANIGNTTSQHSLAVGMAAYESTFWQR